MTSAPSTPTIRHWPGGPTLSTGFTTGPKPALIPRPSGGAPPNWPWNDNCWPSANSSGTTRRQPKPSCADASSATSRNSCLRSRTGGATGQQRRRAESAPPGRQPQDQRRHPVRTGQQQQDDPGLLIRHLARPRTKPPRRLPTTAHCPTSLNCYHQPPQGEMWYGRRPPRLRFERRTVQGITWYSAWAISWPVALNS